MNNTTRTRLVYFVRSAATFVDCGGIIPFERFRATRGGRIFEFRLDFDRNELADDSFNRSKRIDRIIIISFYATGGKLFFT